MTVPLLKYMTRTPGTRTQEPIVNLLRLLVQVLRPLPDHPGVIVTENQSVRADITAAAARLFQLVLHSIPAFSWR